MLQTTLGILKPVLRFSRSLQDADELGSVDWEKDGAASGP